MNLITRQACVDTMTYAPTRPFVRADTASTKLVVAAEPAFDFAGAEYRALHRRSRATAFQGAHWLAALHHDVAPAVGAEPVDGRRARCDGWPPRTGTPIGAASRCAA
jgi:CelD/BcsL family acetyltransferase involved in cellulose biosynthesis